MSQEREFDADLTAAVDAMVAAYGVAGTVDELQARRLGADDEEAARCLEGLAYLRREVAADE